MNLLGYFVVILFGVLVVYGQNVADTIATEPATEPATTKIDPPTTTPSPAETTTSGTVQPTTSPAGGPTTSPTGEPTTSPTAEPTTLPTGEPTASPTDVPTASPSGEPTASPSGVPETTTSPPAPTPSEDLNLFVNNSGSVCILMDMDITLTIEYENATGTTVSNSYVLRDGDVIVDEEQSSNCSGAGDDKEEHLVASIKGAGNELFVQFNLTDSKVSINLLRLSFTDLKSIFPDARPNLSISLSSDSKLFEYSSSKAYKCDAENKVTLVNETGSSTNSFVTFKEVKVKAFRSTSDMNIGDVEDCVQDDNVSDIVPIAVGCALAALVVIVLIAYLIGRRQKRQRGYESV